MRATTTLHATTSIVEAARKKKETSITDAYEKIEAFIYSGKVKGRDAAEIALAVRQDILGLRFKAFRFAANGSIPLGKGLGSLVKSFGFSEKPGMRSFLTSQKRILQQMAEGQGTGQAANEAPPTLAYFSLVLPPHTVRFIESSLDIEFCLISAYTGHIPKGTERLLNLSLEMYCASGLLMGIPLAKGESAQFVTNVGIVAASLELAEGNGQEISNRELDELLA